MSEFDGRISGYFGRNVSFQELEKAVLDAAAEVGWHGEVADVYSIHWQVGGMDAAKGFGKPKNFLDHTEIRLRGKVFPKIIIKTYRTTSLHNFTYFTGLPMITSQRKIDIFLDTAYRNLRQQEPITMETASAL